MNPVTRAEDGLLLRPLRLEDADAVVHAGADPALRRWTDVPKDMTLDGARTFIAQTLQAWLDDTVYAYGAFAEEGGRLVAGGLIRPLDREHGVAEIGGWVAPWARAQGHSVRAMRTCCRIAFEDFGFRRLTAQVEYGNYAARGVVEAVGFTVVGDNPRAFGGHGAWLARVDRPDLREADAPPSPQVRRTLALGTGARRRWRFRTEAGEMSLRLPRAADVDAVVEAYAHPETARWTGAESFTRADAESFVQVYAPDRWRRQEAAVYAIADADDRFVGAIELGFSPEDPEIATVAVMTAPHARSRGVASGAVDAVVRWAFARLGVVRVEAVGEHANTAAIRAAEKAGFVVEGVRRATWLQGGKRTDAFVVSRLPSDLPATDI